MKTINIAKEYTERPGGRYISEGPYSGEDFREKILLPIFNDALKTGDRITVILDGGYGYAPSFLEEAFGGLVRKTKDKTIESIFTIISDEEPKLIDDIKKYIAEEIGKIKWRNLSIYW